MRMIFLNKPLVDNYIHYTVRMNGFKYCMFIF